MNVTSTNERSIRPRRRGAVLLVVLVVVMVLSAMLIQFIERGLVEISTEGHYVRRDRLRIEAYSALETTIGVLADYMAVDGGLSTPAQGWGKPLEIAEYVPRDGLTVTVSFTDESGKLPLATIDEGTLYLLFNEMGFPAEEGLTLTSSLLDWIDADDETRIEGAESDLYSSAEWPYVAGNQPIRKLSELSVVEGFRELFFDEFGRPNDFFRIFSETMSVYSDGTLNANSISDLALRAYVGFGDAQIQALNDYLAGLDGIRGTDDDRYFASPAELSKVFPEIPQGVQMGSGTTLLRIRVEVSEGSADTTFALEAVVRPGQGGTDGQSQGPGQREGSLTDAQVTYPFVFLEIREDVGQNGSGADPLKTVMAAQNLGRGA
jgi:general secretion pathway protein K